MSDLAAALMIAIRVHAGQLDKQGEPYLLHVLRVVETVSDEAKVVAALHDVGEDSDLGIFNVAREAGLGRHELAALCSVSRVPGTTYAEYIARIFADEVGLPIAREVKLADLRDNLGRIPDRPDDDRPVVHATAFGLEKTARPRDVWDSTWPSLKARYEKAIETLEATG